MKLLVIGDVHCVESEIQECQNLVDYVYKIGKLNNVDYFVFLGDEHHNFGIVNLSVSFFWENAFNKLMEIASVIGILGNHSYAKGHKEAHALRRYPIIAIDTFKVINNILFIAHCDNDEFIRICNNNSQYSTVFAHHEFDGGQYDNLFYIKNGIDLNKIPQTSVISGHIHRASQFNKCWYVGAPRWRSISDANQERYIWLLEFTPDGQLASRKGFPTKSVCTPMYEIEDSPEAQFNPPEEWQIIKPKVIINIKGPQDYIEKRQKEFLSLGYRIRTFRTDNINIKIRESEGINKSFKYYFDKYNPKFGTSREILEKMVKERLNAQITW